jgi:hypothetical protein
MVSELIAMVSESWLSASIRLSDEVSRKIIGSPFLRFTPLLLCFSTGCCERVGGGTRAAAA